MVHLRMDNSVYGNCHPACDLIGGVDHETVCLSPLIFKKQPEEDVCMKCAAIFLKRRNAERQEKGLPPVSKYND